MIFDYYYVATSIRQEDSILSQSDLEMLQDWDKRFNDSLPLGSEEGFIEWLESLSPSEIVGASGMYGCEKLGHPWDQYLHFNFLNQNSPIPAAARKLNWLVYYFPNCDWGNITAEQALLEICKESEN